VHTVPGPFLTITLRAEPPRTMANALQTASLVTTSRPAEGCRSGRTGRSRKPLYARAYRGFESHSLRQPTFKGLLFRNFLI
jgi:hypothetical protein